MIELKPKTSLDQKIFDPQDPQAWENLGNLAKLLKSNMLQTIQTAQTGHLGACCSSLELMSALYFTDILQIDAKDPKHPARDLVLVRGHVGPLRYNIFQLLGWLEKEEMNKYRQFGSRLHGHEDMKVTPGVDITPSGSLGMILSYSVGARLSFKNRGLDNRVFCFLGDGEEQEGNVSEAARHAANLRLNRLICIVDQNTKQLSAATSLVDSKTDLPTVWTGYGWKVLEIEDGHDLHQVYSNYQHALQAEDQPVCIVAHTTKGNGIPGNSEHYSGYHVFHGGGNSTETHNQIPIATPLEQLTKQLHDVALTIPEKKITRPAVETVRNLPKINLEPDPSDAEATSYDYLDEYLTKLLKLNISDKLYILTADYPPRKLVYNSDGFKYPQFRYYNLGLREQHLFAMAHGIYQVEKDALLLALCGDAFLYRSADQFNVLAQAGTPLIIYSVQAGVSGAQNGSTHQSSGQPGLMQTMPNMEFFEPSSKRDCFYAMNQAFNNSHGPTYIRTHQNPSPFDLGGFQEAGWYSVKATKQDDCTLVSSGMIANETVKAAQILSEQGVRARVINIVSPKNLAGLSELIVDNKPLFTFYNGNPDVLTSAVAKEALTAKSNRPSSLIAHGFNLGTTGRIKDLMRYLRLDAEGIEKIISDNL